MKNLLLKFALVTLLAGFCFVPPTAQAQFKGYRQSGLIGQVVGLPDTIQQCHILVVSADRRKYAEVFSTDDQLRFHFPLKPGSYLLVVFVAATPDNPTPPPSGTPVLVQVERKTFHDLILVYTPETPESPGGGSRPR